MELALNGALGTRMSERQSISRELGGKTFEWVAVYQYKMHFFGNSV